MTFSQPFGDYEVLERVGAGSMGTVFKARHAKLNRTVALKVLKPSLARDSRYVDRLRREARIVASLNHPNIVTGYDLGQEGGYHFFVMEFIEGQSLRELLSEWGMFSEDRVLDVAIQITTALDHAFSKGVIHRDIKPANILIDRNNVVKLTDMGLAKGPDNLAITRDGATVGTPQYISPEQAKSPQDVDVRSDLYSLGATLFHMCTGQPPFRAETMANVLVKVLEERAPSAAGFNPDLSDGLNLIIRKLLSKDPERRYQTPSELLADLRRVQDSKPPAVQLSELDTGEEEGFPRWLWAGVGAAALVLSGLAFWIFAAPPETPPAGPNPMIAYRKEAVAALAGAETLGDQLERIRQLEIGVTAEDRLGVLADLRRAREQQLIDGLPGFFASQGDALFASMGWGDEPERVKLLVDRRVREVFGLDVRRLPAAARNEYGEGLQKLLQRHESFVRKRDRTFRAAVESYSESIPPDVRRLLRLGDVAGAESTLRELLSGYDGLGGGPPVAQLPREMREFVESSRDAVRTRVAEEIATKERSLHAEFFRALEELKPILAEEPEVAMDLLEDFEQDLIADYPETYFRSGEPWQKADAELRRVRIALDAQRRKAARSGFDQAVKLAYGAAARGDLAAAQRELAFYAAGLDPEREGLHREVLGGAEAVRKKLLRRLLGDGPGPRRLKGIRFRGAPTRVDVERRGEAVALTVAGQVVSMSLLNAKDLIAAAGERFVTGLSPAERAGLALFSVLAGDREVSALLDDRYREVFRGDILDLRLEAEAPGVLVAQTELDRIQRHVEAAEWKEAGDAVALLRGRHAEFAEANQRKLSILEARIDAGQKKAELYRRLQAVQLPGTSLAIADDLSVEVGLDLRSQPIAAELCPGWKQSPGVAPHYDRRQAGLARAREESLRVPSLLDVDAEALLSVELVFEEEREGPRLILLQGHGVTVALGMTRDGAVSLIPVEVDLAQSRGRRQWGREVGKRLRKETKGAAGAVLPGARHVLEISMRQRRGSSQWLVSARLDGSQITKAVVVRRAPAPKAELRILPLAPVAVHRVRFAGRGG